MSNVGQISWGLHSSLERERKIRRRLFASSTKLEIRHFHVEFVQWRPRIVQKSVLHVQSDVTAAILVSQNNETAVMLVSQTSPLGVELFSYGNAFFCSNKFA